MIYGYDFDGVISIGINPSHSDDVIITGRCIDEKEYVINELKKRNINNQVFFNPMTLEKRGNHTIESRMFSGKHKSDVIQMLVGLDVIVTRFFEDDPIQIAILRNENPNLEIVSINSKLVEY